MPDKTSTVLLMSDIDTAQVASLYQSLGLSLELVEQSKAIPGSHWGESEAGLIKHTLYYRNDTPVHSVLHEGGHWLMMSEERRLELHTDAKGSQAEEDAVCYLQVLMASAIPEMGVERMFSDMDSWGYSFMVGSASVWFNTDSDDAKATLLQRLKTQPLLAKQLGLADSAE